ncbi:MAG TPA: formylglycine-generating enzyme family protein, partial [Myxococcota bacterium]|nr:formylglycine-generating enzyme family protein [Myxococcota bacterium]
MALAAGASAGEAGAARVPGGFYTPFRADAGASVVPVAPFLLDERPITNAEFLAFVTREGRWRRSRAPRALADASYLSSWAGDLALGDALPGQPVTFVSWFAASAYCESVGKRLPSEAEWELAANPPQQGVAARDEAKRRILAFYARPRGPLPRAGSSPPNHYGVRDLHGIIWEWVADWDAGRAADGE